MSFGKFFTGSHHGKTTPPGRKARGTLGVPRSYVRSFLESGLVLSSTYTRDHGYCDEDCAQEGEGA